MCKKYIIDKIIEKYELINTWENTMKQNNDFKFATRVAKALAGQFGVAIENGHVSGRKIGDGPSRIVLESLTDESKEHKDRVAYLTRTPDGKVLKSTTVYIKDDDGKVIGLMGINYDISKFISAATTLDEFTKLEDSDAEPEEISRNVADLLDELLMQSEKLIGKPPALMSKDEKVRAIKYLNDNGAFLVTKSGPKVCEFYGISTYTLYSYLDEIKSSDAE